MFNDQKNYLVGLAHTLFLLEKLSQTPKLRNL